MLELTKKTPPSSVQQHVPENKKTPVSKDSDLLNTYLPTAYDAGLQEAVLWGREALRDPSPLQLKQSFYRKKIYNPNKKALLMKTKNTEKENSKQRKKYSKSYM